MTCATHCFNGFRMFDDVQALRNNFYLCSGKDELRTWDGWENAARMEGSIG